MKRILPLIAVLANLVGCVQQPEMPEIAPSPKTAIYDQAEADMLLGKHLFTSVNVSNYNFPYTEFGEATVIDDNGLYRIKGRHEHYYTPYRPVDEREITGGYVEIDGIITEVQERYFIFKGRIETGAIERKFTEQEIQERMEIGRPRSELEGYRVTHTTDPDFKKYLSICVWPQNRLYKFAREHYMDKQSDPGYPVYWRFQTPDTPKSCDRRKRTYEIIDMFTKKLGP